MIENGNRWEEDADLKDVLIWECDRLQGFLIPNNLGEFLRLAEKPPCLGLSETQLIPGSNGDGLLGLKFRDGSEFLVWSPSGDIGKGIISEAQQLTLEVGLRFFNRRQELPSDFEIIVLEREINYSALMVNPAGDIFGDVTNIEDNFYIIKSLAQQNKRINGNGLPYLAPSVFMPMAFGNDQISQLYALNTLKNRDRSDNPRVILGVLDRQDKLLFQRDALKQLLG